MSIRRSFQIFTFVIALAFAFGATSVSSTANACDPMASAAGLC
jgi:hypothetical protein